MADEPDLHAYRLTARRHDDHVPGGLLQVDWLAVAKTARQADTALRNRVGGGWDIVLVRADSATMRQAELRGMILGDVAQA